ncbi:MAG: hypothetical protein RI908_788, partial [Actinomycetota bacterium]
MSTARRIATLAATAIVLAACGERLVYESSTDPTVIGDETEVAQEEK